tara:strand:- start:193 stop:1017 length:825 start_codon:yes stop_codon:yes gene_type:complete
MSETTLQENIPTMEETRKRLKEIYSFTFENEEKTKKTETNIVTNQETGAEEEISVTKDVVDKIPYRVIMKQPTRRQVEEAELEFSVEMSKCIKKGILTKAMLAKKYSDTGGLLAEDDAKALTKMYVKYGELSQENEKLNVKTDGKTEEDKERMKEISGEIANLKKDIINVETSYSHLFNHTADIKAENRVIQWYILNLTYLQKDTEQKSSPMFDGNDFESKLERYYEMEEEGDKLYNIVGGKLAALYSFWYYSSGVVSQEDFEKLDKDIEEGNV